MFAFALVEPEPEEKPEGPVIPEPEPAAPSPRPVGEEGMPVIRDHEVPVIPESEPINSTQNTCPTTM